MTKGYLQIMDNEWVEPSHGEFFEQCCSCGLVHRLKFAVIDKATREIVTGVQVQFKIKIDHRKTAASRRKYKFTKDDA
jgi:hypothetical protein